jgi:hypothetical protein
VSGDQYCTGGSTKGEVCGWSQNWGAAGNWYYDGTGETARRVWHGTKHGHCTAPGDSGGPVYTVRGDGGIAAKGIISGSSGFGGSDWYTGSLESPCENVFTDIWDAYYGLPGYLQTQ